MLRRTHTNENERYFVYALRNKRKEVIYVGQSVDPRQRWGAHKANRKQMTDETETICLTELKSKNEMCAVERTLILLLQPKYNTVQPIGPCTKCIDLRFSKYEKRQFEKDFKWIKKYVLKVEQSEINKQYDLVFSGINL